MEGYRHRQDYNALALKKQIDQIEKVVGSLTLVTTFVTRASTDLVDSTGTSSTMLASAVTEYLVKLSSKKHKKSLVSSLDVVKKKKKVVIEEINDEQEKLRLRILSPDTQLKI